MNPNVSRNAGEFSVRDLMMQLTPDLRASYIQSIMTAVEAAVDPDLGIDKCAGILRANDISWEHIMGLRTQELDAQIGQKLSAGKAPMDSAQFFFKLREQLAN